MAKKTAVGGFDGFGFDPKWTLVFAVASMLIATGVLPRSWRPMLGTASGLAALYQIFKRLGWI